MKCSLNDENNETSDSVDEVHLKQKGSITETGKNSPLNNNNSSYVKLKEYRNKREMIQNIATNTRLYENCVNNCLAEYSNETSSQEELKSIKNESKSLRTECLSGSKSNTKQDKNEGRQLGVLKTNKAELSTQGKHRLNFKEKLSERELEGLVNDFSSDSELECKLSEVQSVSSIGSDVKLIYKAPAVCQVDSDSEMEHKRQADYPPSSSSSFYSESKEERSESPVMKTMEEMIEQNRRCMEESLSSKHEDVKCTLNFESFKRSPVKLKLKRTIASPSSSDSSPNKYPQRQKTESDTQSANSSPSNHKLRVRRKYKSSKWIITNSESKVGKRSDKRIKRKRKMSSWEVVNEKTSHSCSVSRCDNNDSDMTVRSPLRDRSKIRLPAWRVDDDPKSKTLKISLPKCDVNSVVSLKVASKEKENKTPRKNQEDDNFVTTPPLRDRSKLKLPAWRLDDDSRVRSDNNRCGVNSPRLSSRIAKRQENKTAKYREDLTHDRNRNGVIHSLRDRSKIKLPSWQQEDKCKCTPGKNISSTSSMNSPRIKTRLSRQLEQEDSNHANDNSVLSTPKRRHSYLAQSSKKKRSPKKCVDSSSSSSEYSEDDSAVHLKNNVEMPVRQLLNSTPKSSRNCEKKINITTPLSRKSGGRLLLTPKIEEKNLKLQGTTPSTPLDEARIQLHISTVPSSLPCRQKEFTNIQGFLLRKIVDHVGGSMYISGMPGTGKTATVYAVIRALQQAADNNDVPKFDFVEVNGLKLTEPRQAYVRILQSLTGQRVTAEQAHGLLEKRFSRKCNKSVILFVDELDYLCNRRQDVIYNILDWPTKHSSGLVVLTVSNTMDLPERTLKGRVTSRMGLTRLSFQPYTHHQLQEIVQNRLAGNSCFHPDAVQLVARKVAAVSGDARRALDICRRATELVSNDEQITVKHVEEALTQIFTGPRVVTIQNCSQAAQMVLRALRDETHRTGVEETNVIQVYNHLVSICTLEGLPVPKVGEVLSICTTLSLLGLVIAEKGRPDIMRKLSLNVSSDDIHYAINCA